MKPVGKTASSHTKFILNIDFCYVTWPMSFATVWNELSAQRSLRTDLIHCCFSCIRLNIQQLDGEGSTPDRKNKTGSVRITRVRVTTVAVEKQISITCCEWV